MNFRACSSVSRHVLCLICVIFYDGPLIFSWLNWSILYIFQFICYTKKNEILVFDHFFLLFSSLSLYLRGFLSTHLFFYLWTFEYRALGFVCIFLSSYLYAVLHFNALLSNICSHFRCADGICGHFFWIHCRLFAIGRSISFIYIGFLCCYTVMLLRWTI